MKRFMLLCLFVLTVSPAALAQTATPSSSEYIYATVPAGQMTRFDFVSTAGQVHIVNLLTFLFISLWGMFLFAVFVVKKGKRA